MAFLSGVTSLVTSSPTVLAVSAGVLAGVVTGTAVVASGVLSSPAPEQLALVSCPASETVVARVSSGQSMLVTAKSGDGTWLQLFIGEPGIDSGWAPADALRIADPLDALPIRGCEVAAQPSGLLPPPPTPIVTAIVDPTPTPTPLPSGVTPPPPTPTPFPTPTPKQTPPKSLPPGVTPTPFVATPLPPPPTFPPTAPPPTPPPPTAPPPSAPPPTPPPDLTPPSISNFAITLATLFNGEYYIDNSGNPCGTSQQARVSATITDSGGSGLNGPQVRLRFWSTAGVQYDLPMSHPIGSSTWGATINNQAGWPAGQIVYWMYAADNAGNSTTTNAPPPGAPVLKKGDCGVG